MKIWNFGKRFWLYRSVNLILALILSFGFMVKPAEADSLQGLKVPSVLSQNTPELLADFNNVRAKVSVYLDGWEAGKARLRVDMQRLYQDSASVIGYRLRIFPYGKTSVRDYLHYEFAGTNDSQYTRYVFNPDQKYWVEYLLRYKSGSVVYLYRIARLEIIIPKEESGASSSTPLPTIYPSPIISVVPTVYPTVVPTIVPTPAPLVQTQTGIEVSYLGKLGDFTGAGNYLPDGASDSGIRVKLVGQKSETISKLEVKSSIGGVWNTAQNSPNWYLKGVLDSNGILLNTPLRTVNFPLNPSQTFTIYFSDTLNNDYVPAGSVLTVLVTLSSGQEISANVFAIPGATGASQTNSGNPPQPGGSPNLEIDTANIVNFSPVNKSVNEPSRNVNGQPVVRLDTDGNAIDAHDGEIKKFGNTYYLYGTSYNCGFEYLSYNQKPFCGFKSYSSQDMVHWKDEGLLFDPSSQYWQTLCASLGCFRPHMIYNQQTGQYVLWINAATNDVGYRVLTSSSPVSGFVLQSLPNQMKRKAWAGDHNLFVDDNGSAYIIGTNYGVEGEVFKLVVEKLNGSYTDATGEFSYVSQEGLGEAPSIVKRNGIYYLLYNPGCPYCPESPTRYFTSFSPMGPWVYKGEISATSCGGQPAHIEKIGDRYLYMSDLWHQNKPFVFTEETKHKIYKNQGRANYFWSTLSFASDGSLQPLVCSQSLPNPFVVSSGSQKSIYNLDQSSGVSGFSQVCDIDSTKPRLQKFTAGKTGRLNSVSVNVFQSGQLGDAFVNGDLVLEISEMSGSQPGSVLYSQVVAKNAIGFSARKVTIQPNISVSAGKTYAVTLKTSSQGQGCYGVLYSDANPYNLGESMVFGGGGYTAETNRDIKFETQVQ